MHRPEPSPLPPAPQDSEPLPAWEAPRLTRFGPVAELTQGIANRIGDGISNLTP